MSEQKNQKNPTQAMIEKGIPAKIVHKATDLLIDWLINQSGGNEACAPSDDLQEAHQPFDCQYIKNTD
jgi:hypothetical protein